MPKICICLEFLSDKQKEAIKECLKDQDYEVAFFTPEEMDEALKYVQDAEILYSHYPELLRGGKQLKWFCCSHAGVDVYCKDPSLFPNDECILTNSNVYGLTIAEHIIMVSLMLLRKEGIYFHNSIYRQWQGNHPIKSIYDSTVLILSTGHIAQETAKRFKTLECRKIIGLNTDGHEAPYFDETYPMTQLNDHLPEADLVILALPSTSRTYHIIKNEQLSLMRQDAYLINVGRGDVIDEDALIKALNGQQIAGAALDVFEQEPLPFNHPLWNCKNIIITPHVSGNMTLEYTREANVLSFIEDLNNYLNHQPLKHQVDRKRGY